jgi:hypothetical protein
MVKRNIEQIALINKSYHKDPNRSPKSLKEDMNNHYLMCQNHDLIDETVTETNESMAEQFDASNQQFSSQKPVRGSRNDNSHSN